MTTSVPGTWASRGLGLKHVRDAYDSPSPQTPTSAYGRLQSPLKTKDSPSISMQHRRHASLSEASSPYKERRAAPVLAKSPKRDTGARSKQPLIVDKENIAFQNLTRIWKPLPFDAPEVINNEHELNKDQKTRLSDTGLFLPIIDTPLKTDDVDEPSTPTTAYDDSESFTLSDDDDSFLSSPPLKQMDHKKSASFSSKREKEDHQDSPKKRAKRKRSSTSVEIPCFYDSTTIAARAGSSRLQYKKLRDEEIVPRTPPKKKKQRKLQSKIKDAPKAFKASYISPTKTSTYTRLQARNYRKVIQESAKELNDWRARFLESINVICRHLKESKSSNKKASSSYFNTLFLKHFTESEPDFFDEVYVQDTHVFFWSSKMVDLDLKDKRGESNREKLKRGNNFMLFQSVDKGKTDIVIDENGDFKLSATVREEDIEPSESNWLHLTQGKTGKSTFRPKAIEEGSAVGAIAKQYYNKDINIVFAGPRDIHSALHHIMNQFKRKDETSVHQIPSGYTRERPLANKEILKRKLRAQAL